MSFTLVRLNAKFPLDTQVNAFLPFGPVIPKLFSNAANPDRTLPS
jgi:hypothetical protein